jgi:hypothetical protein
VCATLLAGATDARATNYGRAASSTAAQLSNAGGERAAKRALMRLMRTSNVTVLGKRGGRLRVLVRGFASSPRDLFFVEPQIDALARVARSPARPPVSHLAAALTQLPGKPVSGEQAARALRQWIAQARKGRKRDPGVYLPRVIDRLAKRRGVDLADAEATTRLSGIELFLVQMSLAPGRPRGARGSVVQAGGVCSDLLEGGGVATWVARGIGEFLVSVLDGALPPFLTVKSITATAVALGTDVRLEAGSEPLEGRPTPIHWQHDEDAQADLARFKLLFVNDLPIPRELSACLKLAGVDAPPQGGRRAGVPVIWWLGDGEAEVPEMAGQTLKMQGQWEREGPASSLSDVAELISTFTGGRLLDVTESGADGVSTMKLTPRREKGPHPGADARIEGELLAVPLTAGTDGGVQQIANIFSAVVRNQEFKVRIAHHVKVGWQFARPTTGAYDAEFTTGPPPEHTHYDYAFQGFRCALTPEVAPTLDPSTPRTEPVGLAGNWYSLPGGRLIVTGSDGTQQTAPYRPVFVVPEAVGATDGIGTKEQGTVRRSDGTAHEQTRLADTPEAGHLRIDYFNDFNGDDGDYDATQLDSDEVEVVPIASAAELPLDYPCQRTELLTEP